MPYLANRWVTDESWYAAPGYSVAHGGGLRDIAVGPNDLENHVDTRPPATALEIALFFKLFGAGVITARVGSILAGLAIVCLTFFLARDLFGEQGAAVATMLTATDNLIVLTSRSARPEALTTMCVLLAMLAMKRYAAGRAWGVAFLSGLLMAAGTMCHITVGGYIVALGLLAVFIDYKAIDHEREGGRRGVPWRGVTFYIAGYFIGLIPFATWIFVAPMGKDGFHAEYLGRAVNTSLLDKFLLEGHRYRDILGLNLIDGHGLESIPLRLPIPLVFLAASVVLFRFRRGWFYVEMVLLCPSALWLIYTVNKSSRYVAILAPLFGLAIGAAVAATREKRQVHGFMLLAACAVILAQLGTNLVLLASAREANYGKVATELHSVIPPDATVYGTMTLWLAFRDQPFISYERTDPWRAAREDHARYFILGDRVMVSGLENDERFYADLRAHLQEVVAHSQQVGHFDDPYYGTLDVYKLREP